MKKNIIIFTFGFFLIFFFLGWLFSETEQQFILEIHYNYDIALWIQIRDIFFKHARGVLFIFLVGLTKLKRLVFVPLAWRGIGLGFVSGIFFITFGNIRYSFFVFGVQSLILVFIYFVAIYNVFESKNVLKNKNHKYILHMLICLVTVFFIAVYEIILLPQMLAWIFS